MSAADAPDTACLVAHADAAPLPAGAGSGTAPVVVAVFATGMTTHLVHFARHLGWRTLVVDPSGVPDRIAATVDAVDVALTPALVEGADVVVTDHHREELGPLLRDALAARARWVGVMGNPRHEGPHVAALRGLGVADDEIARVHRPIGLDIGSRTPEEVAVAVAAEIVAVARGKAASRGQGAAVA